MNKGIWVAFLVIGVVLVVFGARASDSLSSDVSRFFTGSPTDKSMWLLVGGLATSAVGVFGLFRGAKGS